MTITLRQLLLILGGVLLSIGLVLGFSPISQDGGPCGSAFSSNSAARVEAHTRAMIGSGDPYDFLASCQDAKTSRRTVALALTIPGALLGLAGLLVGGADTPTAAARSREAV